MRISSKNERFIDYIEIEITLDKEDLANLIQDGFLNWGGVDAKKNIKIKLELNSKRE